MKVLEAMEGFTFGCDPELFILDDRRRFVSAAGLLPGTKEEPYKVVGGAVQVDGNAAEFNIDPVDNYVAWDIYIGHVVSQMQDMLPKGYTLVDKASVRFDEDVWATIPDHAKELGCSPDFNAWTGGVNPPPNLPEDPRLRCAGGHIHIGWVENEDPSDYSHVKNCRDLVKQLDYFLGAWSLIEDKDPTRRLLYGKAGACRYKPYGVEYRTLSNFWVLDEKKRLEVWNRMQQAIHKMATQFFPDAVGANYAFNPALIEAINTSTRNLDLEGAFKFPILNWDDEPISVQEVTGQMQEYLNTAAGVQAVTYQNMYTTKTAQYIIPGPNDPEW